MNRNYTAQGLGVRTTGSGRGKLQPRERMESGSGHRRPAKEVNEWRCRAGISCIGDRCASSCVAGLMMRAWVGGYKFPCP